MTSYLFLLRYLRPYKKYFLIGLCAIIFSSVILLSLGQILKGLLDSSFTGHDIRFLAFLLFIGILLLSLSIFARLYFIGCGGEKTIANIRCTLYNHLITLSVHFFERSHTADIMTSLIADTTLLQNIIITRFAIALRNILNLCGGLIMLIHTSPKLSACAAVMLPIVVLFIVLLGKKVRKLSRAYREQLSSIAVHSNETYSHIKIVQAFSQEQIEKRRFAERVHNTQNAGIKYLFFRALLVVLVITTVFIAISILVWLASQDVITAQMSSGTLFSFIFYAVIVAGAVGGIGEIFSDIQSAIGISEKIDELLQSKPVLATTTPTVKTLYKIHEIEFKKVFFAYPAHKSSNTINDFSLHIKTNEVVALVGPSGAGKSTILQLLMRFYDIDKGNIFINNYDIREIELTTLRQVFSLVPQEPMLFSTTILENIKYGKSTACFEEVYNAAVSANAIEFIEKLPQKFDTFIGNKGTRLSTGQKQRIAIARAILKAPQILLLDEATSALDSENERLVQTTLQNLINRCTTIVIAHRLSTVLKADKIIFMKEGRVCEIGTHEQLMSKNGSYAKLVHLQFAY